MLTDDAGYRTLKTLQSRPGIRLGKINYCLEALIDKGAIKANNFSNSEHKSGYLYVLTPSGVEDKPRITVRFLKRKVEEYEALKLEIEEIQKELGASE